MGLPDLYPDPESDEVMPCGEGMCQCDCIDQAHACGCDCPPDDEDDQG